MAYSIRTDHNDKPYTVTFNHWGRPFRILVYTRSGPGRMATWREVWPKQGKLDLSPAMTAIVRPAQERLFASCPEFPRMVTL